MVEIFISEINEKISKYTTFLTQFMRDFYNKLMKVFDNLQFQRKSNIKFQFQFSKVKFK